jgi:hypothetical protein
MQFKHGYAGVAGTSHQPNIKTQVVLRLFKSSVLCERQNLTLLATSQEAEGRADYQQTDTTSISTNTAQMAAVSTKWGQLHRRWMLGQGADSYTEGGCFTSTCTTSL